MKFQVSVGLFAAITPFVAAHYEVRTSLNERISELRKKRKLAESNGLEAAQTFLVPLPESVLFHETFTSINDNAVGGVNSLVAFSISTDGTKIYYDHWEDGYEENPMQPTQASTQIWGDGDYTNGCRPDITCNAENATLDVLNSGDSIVAENMVPLGHGEGTTFLFDGRDLVQALYPIAITIGAYPSYPGVYMAGALEVFDVQHWGMNYKIPVDTNTASDFRAFEYVGLYFMAAEDNTTLSDANGVEITTLSKGESYYMDAEAGTRGSMISANNRVMANLVTGAVQSEYELRWFSLRPLEVWTNSYLSPVGDTTGMNRVMVYNPHETNLDVKYETAAGEFNMTVAPNGVQYTDIIDDDYACKLTASENFIAFAMTDTDDTSMDDGQLYDWGCPVMPTDMLTSVALVGWGYGCTADECDYFYDTQARSVVFVAPMSDATIYVDFKNDGTVDASQEVNYLSSTRITNPNGEHDMSGSVIWATENGTGPDGPQVAIAVAWGQWAGDTFGGDIDAMDLGTLVVPFAPISGTKSLSLVNDLGGDGAVGPGDTIQYSIEVVNVGPSNIAENLITIKDTLDDNVVYVEGTTQYVDQLGNAIPISDDDVGTPFPLDGGGIPNAAALPRGDAHHVLFNVKVSEDDQITSISNEGTVCVWANCFKFEKIEVVVPQVPEPAPLVDSCSEL